MTGKIYTLPTLCESRLAIINTKARNIHKSQEQLRHTEEEAGILIFDTGGERNGTITRREWHVFEYTNHKQRILGKQDKSEGKVYPTVNAATKAWIHGRYMTVLLVKNYDTFLDNPYETESLDVNFETIKHGTTVDITPRNLYGYGGLYVDE